MLWEVRANSDALRVMLIKHAEQFNEHATIIEFKNGQLNWLEDAVVTIRANSTLNDHQIVGLLILMVALRGSAANHIATFWSDVKVEH